MDIRPEKLEDVGAVRQVNIAAFARENEANLETGILQDCSGIVKYRSEFKMCE